MSNLLALLNKYNNFGSAKKNESVIDPNSLNYSSTPGILHLNNGQVSLRSLMYNRDDVKTIMETNQQKIKNNLNKTSLSGEQKKDIYLGLQQILNSEKRFEPGKNPTVEQFAEHKENAFYMHETLVRIAFGEIKPLKVFNLSENAVENLSGYLLNLETVNFTSLEHDVHDYLWLTHYAKNDKYTELDKNLIFLDFKMSDLIQKFHQVLRTNISECIKSPFAIVNTKAWITKPGTPRYGPNEEHTDKFAEGHVKVMIYLTPLSDEYGTFWIDGNLFTSKNPGSCIYFRNSEILHSGIPGSKYPRVCIEITIFRTFIDCDQFHHGHPNGKHYIDLVTPYLASTNV